MKIKVCGMRERDNVQELSQLPIDYVGFIFYKPSKRFVESKIENLNLEGKKKVGVFVNELLNVVLEKVGDYELEAVQLHGAESAEYCSQLKTFLSLAKPPNSLKGESLNQKGGSGIELIKAFSIDKDFDFAQTKEFEAHCDYFLFDTKGKLPGGNGYTFDWKLLENYKGEIPFFLSGGITQQHADIIKSLDFRQLHAIDLNSGFEIEPALKDISLLKKFIQDVNN